MDDLQLAVSLTVVVSEDATSTSTAISGVASEEAFVVITNEGPNTVFVRFGVGAQTATVADIPCLAFQATPVPVAPSVTHMGSICNTGETAKFYGTPARKR